MPIWVPCSTFAWWKNEGKSQFFAHTILFCACYLLIFDAFSHFCKHAVAKNGNAKFFFGVDFLKPAMPNFRQIQPNRLNDNHLAKPLKTRKFSTKSFLAQNFWILEGLNGHFVNIFHKTRPGSSVPLLNIGCPIWRSLESKLLIVTASSASTSHCRGGGSGRHTPMKSV